MNKNTTISHSFFHRALEGNNKWWTYLIGLIMISVGMTLGQMPLLIVLILKMAEIGTNNPEILKEANERIMEYDFSYFGLDANLTFFLILLSFVGIVIFLWINLKWIHKRPFKSLTTPLQKINWKKIAFGFLLWFGISAGLEIVSYYSDPSNYVWTFEWGSFIPLLFLCIFVLPLQTSAEEWVMRGYLMQGLPLQPAVILLTSLALAFSMHFMMLVQDGVGQLVSVSSVYLIVFFILTILFYLEHKNILKTGLAQLFRYPIVPLIITSVIFGLLHIMNPEVEKFGLYKMMTIYVGMGFMLGLITVLDESLELALGIHFGNNLFGALFVSFEGSALQTPTMFRTLEINAESMVTGWFIVAVVFFIILQLKYKWKDWGKLFRPVQKIEP